jgi:pseudaminic acid cytidylyltransferase
MGSDVSKSVAIIPARGGSKRVPRKNIRSFTGKPMIGWAIDAVRESGCFDRVIVSTDDAEIADVARDLGAEVPFMRPADLADDFSGTGAVVAHAIRSLQAAGECPHLVCCVYATNPLLRAADLCAGRDLLLAGNWQFVFAATRFGAPVQRGFQKLEGGGLAMLFPEHAATRSQDLPAIYHDAAQFYWGRSDVWLSGDPMFGARSAIVQIPAWRSVDIDNEEDWQRAELVFQAIRRGEVRGS